jgi:Icc-related predicted phosphoesterase
MRVAATADLHFSPQAYDRVREPFSHIRDEADVLVIAGDLTNYGTPEEMHSLLNALVRLRLPIVAVLGNHDYESGREQELIKMLRDEGVKVLDGSSYERDGVGFAGTKGFLGGFGRGMLTSFGEKEVKLFVQAALDETMKLERALTMLRAEKLVIVTHYAPIAETVHGEPVEIWPYLGNSRLSEVIDRHQAVLALHGHAHHGQLDGKTVGGIPVHNVALSLLMKHNGGKPYRVFEV